MQWPMGQGWPQQQLVAMSHSPAPQQPGVAAMPAQMMMAHGAAQQQHAKPQQIMGPLMMGPQMMGANPMMMMEGWPPVDKFRYLSKGCRVAGHWLRDGLCQPEDVVAKMTRDYVQMQ
jgi:hypothetical protein